MTNSNASEDARSKLYARNVTLIGMPGAGKSTLGVVLAKMLNKGFIDCDLVIQQQCRRTLQNIIDTEGNEAFIALEGRIVSSLHAADSIIATGGSAVYSEKAMAHLKDIGIIVYLEISYESLVERLGNLDERGVVFRGEGQVDLRGLFEQRKPLYERHADVVVNVDTLSLSAAVQKVADAIR